jgi:hypothetical protein
VLGRDTSRGQESVLPQVPVFVTFSLSYLAQSHFRTYL